MSFVFIGMPLRQFLIKDTCLGTLALAALRRKLGYSGGCPLTSSCSNTCSSATLTEACSDFTVFPVHGCIMFFRKSPDIIILCLSPSPSVHFMRLFVSMLYPSGRRIKKTLKYLLTKWKLGVWPTVSRTFSHEMLYLVFAHTSHGK